MLMEHASPQQHQQPTSKPLHWMPAPLRKAFQETQNSINNLALKLQQGLNHGHTHSSPQQLKGVVQATDVVNQNLKTQLEAWNKNSAWTDQPPVVKVSVPKGTLCHLDTSFQLGLPPDALFDIVIDPGNKRVFKNIKEVTYREVLEDEGHRQLVEVEHSAIWRFLCFSGTLSVRVFVDQNRRTHSVNFYLAREGFMKKFEGIWDIKPVYVDSPHCAVIPSPENDPVCTSSRIASEINLKQIVQPALIPPPPVSWYIRGITAKQTLFLIEDLQAEAKRLRESNSTQDNSQKEQQHGTLSGHSEPLLKREPEQGERFTRFSNRKGRKSGWRLKKPAKSI